MIAVWKRIGRKLRKGKAWLIVRLPISCPYCAVFKNVIISFSLTRVYLFTKPLSPHVSIFTNQCPFPFSAPSLNHLSFGLYHIKSLKVFLWFLDVKISPSIALPCLTVPHCSELVHPSSGLLLSVSTIKRGGKAHMLTLKKKKKK